MHSIQAAAYALIAIHSLRKIFAKIRFQVSRESPVELRVILFDSKSCKPSHIPVAICIDWDTAQTLASKASQFSEVSIYPVPQDTYSSRTLTSLKSLKIIMLPVDLDGGLESIYMNILEAANRLRVRVPGKGK